MSMVVLGFSSSSDYLKVCVMVVSVSSSAHDLLVMILS